MNSKLSIKTLQQGLLEGAVPVLVLLGRIKISSVEEAGVLKHQAAGCMSSRS